MIIPVDSKDVDISRDEQKSIVRGIILGFSVCGFEPRRENALRQGNKWELDKLVASLSDHILLSIECERDSLSALESNPRHFRVRLFFG